MPSSRRQILRRSCIGFGAVGALGLIPSLQIQGASECDAMDVHQSQEQEFGLPIGWRKMRKIDLHNHVFDLVHLPNANWKRVEAMVEAAGILGIERLCCSRPITGGALVEIDQVIDSNNAVLAAMQRFPEKLDGFCFVQPGNGRAALDEIDRCLDKGMLGVKLYNQFKYSDPIVFSIAEKCIERDIPFLGHSAHLTDAKSLAAQPKTSDSLDFCQLSGRYPKLKLVLGHVNGGGDWEWAIKGLRDCPNVLLDTSGSVLESDTIEYCVEELGADRILFATDQTMEGCVGKILTADLTPEDREKIFWKNAQRILKRARS